MDGVGGKPSEKTKNEKVDERGIDHKGGHIIMFKIIRREMGRVIGWSGPGLGERYIKRRTEPCGKI